MTDPIPNVDSPDAEEDLGIFGSWSALYTALAIYGVLTIVILRILTVAMNAEPAP